MKGYCPYTNIDGEKLAQNIGPHLLVVGGLNDPRVAFFEPLKWTAKMRGEKSRWRKILQQRAQDIDTHSSSVSSPLRENAVRDDLDTLAEPRPSINVMSNIGRAPSWAGSLMDSPSTTTGPDGVQGEKMLLLRINDSGHGGTSGTYSYQEDLAIEYAFLIYTLEAAIRPIFPGFPASEGPALLQGMYSGPAATLYGLHEHASARISSGLAGLGVEEGSESDDSESANAATITSTGNHDSRGKSSGKRKGGGAATDVEETEYRSRGNKGDRGQSKLYQWMANWF
ncbi:hypothetical protein SmJEL517_g06210 [Synchytrium microbalum]|uniref:Peptidase S9 prolyl oligopeptidase catalytic domain-containing protein n=1 Tax=Synchytrium microbalum TaxID=1806994 RepID=A0A507BSQ0_9FUNG|nr:uncharacterized protein SmJEL517_g06210 [Synchytrium microbalum]TPX30169.1 hypothetical protein SmJEL517_g06210 [Synchytrium microbalum]